MNASKSLWFALMLVLTLFTTACNPSAQGKLDPLATSYRSFISVGPRLGAMHISTMAMLMPSESAAEDDFPKAVTYFEESVEGALGEDATIVSPSKKIPAPNIGDQSTALEVTFESDSSELVAVTLLVRHGRVIHALAGVGTENTLHDLVDAAYGNLGTDADPSDDASMMELLINLDELPEGFAIDPKSELITR